MAVFLVAFFNIILAASSAALNAEQQGLMRRIRRDTEGMHGTVVLASSLHDAEEADPAVLMQGHVKVSHDSLHAKNAHHATGTDLTTSRTRMDDRVSSGSSLQNSKEWRKQPMNLRSQALVKKLIPPQLLMTGPHAHIDAFPQAARENIEKTRKLAPGLKFRYLSDSDCSKYIEEHFGGELFERFNSEVHGSFRGDICRSAVLLREGGFYLDLDVELNVPLQELIDERTTFMSAFAANIQPDHKESGPVPLILNALIAVTPQHSIMQRVVEKIPKWFDGHARGSLLGPTVMQESIAEAILDKCPDVAFSRQGSGIENGQGHPVPGEAACGTETFRFFQEEYLGGSFGGTACKDKGEIVCPMERATGPFEVQLGLFRIGKEPLSERLIGWPRYAKCTKYGCGINGGQVSFW